MKTEKFPRFSKGDVVDVRWPPGVKLGDWEQGEITEVRKYAAGPLYKVRTFSGKLLTIEEYDLVKADK